MQNETQQTTDELTSLARGIVLAGIISPLLIVITHPPILNDIYFLAVTALTFTSLVTLVAGITRVYRELRTTEETSNKQS